MNVYQIVSTALALLLYIPLVRAILRREVEQSLATFILWGTLDAVAAISLIAQGGNWYLPAAYVGGCSVVVYSLVKTNSSSEWTWFESAMCVLVFLCVVGWYFSGPWLATILSSAGMAFGGFPQVKDAWNAPHKMPLWIYVGYTITNILGTMGGKAWTVEERLYPSICVILCVVIVVLSCRKFLEVKAEPQFSEDPMEWD